MNDAELLVEWIRDHGVECFLGRALGEATILIGTVLPHARIYLGDDCIYLWGNMNRRWRIDFDLQGLEEAIEWVKAG